MMARNFYHSQSVEPPQKAISMLQKGRVGRSNLENHWRCGLVTWWVLFQLQNHQIFGKTWTSGPTVGGEAACRTCCGPGGSSQERSGEAHKFHWEEPKGPWNPASLPLKTSRRRNQTTFPYISYDFLDWTWSLGRHQGPHFLRPFTQSWSSLRHTQPRRRRRVMPASRSRKRRRFRCLWAYHPTAGCDGDMVTPKKGMPTPLPPSAKEKTVPGCCFFGGRGRSNCHEMYFPKRVDRFSCWFPNNMKTRCARIGFCGSLAHPDGHVHWEMKCRFLSFDFIWCGAVEFCN